MRAGIIDSEVNDLWCVAHDSGELGTAVTSYDITGLEGDTDVEYQLICRFIDDSTVGDYKLTFNTDTGTNYGYQDIKGIDSTASAIRDTSEAYWHIGQTSADDYICFSETSIFSKSGVVRTGISTYAYDITGTTVTGIIKRGHSWNNTADEITQMVITAGADNINIGSRIILLKKVHNDGMKTGTLTPNKIEGAWERIYDSTLSSAATSVTISDLEGDTDCLYRLVTRGISGYAGSAFIQIQPNADATTSNYGYQSLRGDSTTASAARATTYDGILCGYSTAITRLFFSDVLLYAKSGYERTALSNIVNNITGTTVSQINLTGGVWDNTADEITSLRLISSQADGLGIGTHIELYRLNL